MSKTIKFTISDENYAALEELANAANLNIQDYVRSVLFPKQNILTPQLAVDRALKQFKPGDEFTVPQIFGDDWNLPNGVAGQFGKKFYNLVESEYSSKIEFTGNFSKKKHAVYRIR